ncbi:MAG TPA: hypothetical protein VJ723_09535, partial [Candidatus Angelobacter sp.]|nr:hypothetical protein [Candidatus Angelobacter sp.]
TSQMKNAVVHKIETKYGAHAHKEGRSFISAESVLASPIACSSLRITSRCCQCAPRPGLCWTLMVWNAADSSGDHRRLF